MGFLCACNGARPVYLEPNMVLERLGISVADLMDVIKIYGIISHPLYLRNSKSFMLIFPFSMCLLILGTSLAIASIRFRTVLQTRV